MDESQLQFRTVTFGGFQKQDVLDYLEKIAADHAERISALQRDLDRAHTASEDASHALSDQQNRVAALRAENQRMEMEIGTLQEEIKQLTQQRESLSKQVRDLTAQINALNQSIRKLSPAAEAYENIKDRTAGIELEAHGRAHAIEAAAQAKAKKTRVELEGWFDKLESAYAKLQTDLEVTIAKASGELRQVEQGLDRFTNEFSSQDTLLQQLRQTLDTLSGPKPPQPIPLEDKR